MPQIRRASALVPALLLALLISTSTASAANNGPLVFEGGEAGVHHHPEIHLILWGPKSYWNENSEGIAVKQKLEQFYKGLSGSAWQGILTQYYDYATHIGSTVTFVPPYISEFYWGTAIDFESLPQIVSDAITANKGLKSWAITPSSQYVIVAAQGWKSNTNFADNFGCALHSWGQVKGAGPRFSYAFLANYNNQWLLERCGLYSKTPINILTAMASHEYAESATDPETGFETSTWVSQDNSDPNGAGHEIADICVRSSENVAKEGTGTLAGVYLSPLWDNSKGGCTFEDPNPPFPSPQQPQPFVQANNGKVHVFWRGADGELEGSYSTDEGLTWSNVADLSSDMMGSQPSVVEPSSGRIAVFWKDGHRDDIPGTDCFGYARDHLREAEYNGSSWSSPFPCHSQTPLGPMAGRPAAVVQPNGTVNVFWRGKGDNQLWYASQTGSSWSAATSLGGSMISDPTVVQSGTDTIKVFWKNGAGGLQTRSYTESTGVWQPEQNLLPSMLSSVGPTAFAKSDGNVEVLWPIGSLLVHEWSEGGSWHYGSIPAIENRNNANPLYQPIGTGTGNGNAQLWYTTNTGELWSATYSAESKAWSPAVVFAAGGGPGTVGTQPQAAASAAGRPVVSWMDPNIEGVYAASNNGEWRPRTLVSPMQGIAPTAKTGVAINGTETGATLTGTLSPGRAKTEYRFKYGHTTGYGKETSTQTSSSSVPIQANGPLSNLEPGTNYHYRLIAQNEFVGSPVEGADEVFTPGWSIGTPAGSYLSGVSCTSTSQCTAVGYTGSNPRMPLAERWNGTTWETQTLELPSEAKEALLNGVSCSSAGSCMAVGYYKDKNGSFLTLAERWLEGKWKIISTQNKAVKAGEESFNYLNGVSCISASQCVAVGDYLTRTGPGSSEVTKVMGQYMNGEGKFVMQEMPVVESSTHSELQSISCVSYEECTAVGYYRSPSNAMRPLTAQWFGTVGWTTSALPVPSGATNGWLYGVSCPSASYCMAAGFDRTSSDKWEPLALRRNGTKYVSWEAQTLPSGEEGAESYLYGISCTSKEDCTAVGDYRGGPARTLSETWDGTQWKAHYPLNPAGKTENGSLDLTGVSCPHLGACTAVGFFQSSFEGLSALVDSYSVKPPPTVTTTAASGITTSEATLNGTVNPNGVKTSYYFEYGPTASYGSNTSSSEIGEGQSPSFVSKRITGLAVNTTYHYRVVATNTAGFTQKGEDKTFTTERGWSVQPTPNPEGPGARLNGVACIGNAPCTAVGEYRTYLGFTRPLAEFWNSSEWGIQPTPEEPKEFEASTLVDVSCLASGECLAVGHYASGGIDQARAERWTGSKWELQSLPLPEGAISSDLESISCNSAGRCTAVGRYVTGAGVTRLLAERWTGTQWELQVVPEPEGAKTSELNGISCNRWTVLGKAFDECVAVGAYTKGGNPEAFSERWTGSKWEARTITAPLGSKGTHLVAISCPTPTTTLTLACMAVGYYTSAGVNVALAQRWSGTAWEAQPSLGEATKLAGVSCSSSTVCIAVGAFEVEGGTRPASRRWKESLWEGMVMPPLEGAPLSALESVFCASSGNCTAVGYAGTASGEYFTLAERYS